MEDKDIIKALELCQQHIRCAECPMWRSRDCMSKLYEYASDLINRQKAEIESLQNIKFRYEILQKNAGDIK